MQNAIPLVDASSLDRMGAMFQNFIRHLIETPLLKNKPLYTKGRLGILPRTCPEHGIDLTEPITIHAIGGKHPKPLHALQCTLCDYHVIISQ